MSNLESARIPPEFIIYTDESEKEGKYYSNFYGGVLVRSYHLAQIITQLEEAKVRQNFLGEVKWQKVTSHYLDKYKALMDTFFNFVTDDKIKVRIMFTQNRIVPVGLTNEQMQNEFHLLYYQFLKHAFGLVYANHSNEMIKIRVNLDQLPESAEQNAAFKSFILRLNFNPQFRDAKLTFNQQQIAEVSSHEHVLMQCLDVVLGAMCFRLNDKHLEIPEGQTRRGKRTVAKENLYRHILTRIRNIYPGFNIGESTGTNGDASNCWRQPYRHWKFIPEAHSFIKKGGKQK